ncbi:hypothetical protein EYF80_061708 [Liparis tanakae]|uniref:Uncharacterized protein n=1 Tax=Liparis tanakae TaxID=230148 RepID=A0A4Z2EI45_9TELE|nr:hypothetical protein EYF80_061708 [Liparis tanakae]
MEGPGHREQDRRVRTEEAGEREQDRRVRMEGPGHREQDRRVRTEGAGEREQDGGDDSVNASFSYGANRQTASKVKGRFRSDELENFSLYFAPAVPIDCNRVTD